MKRITTIVVALLVTAVLSGCNTTRGFGQDVQKLGSTISHAAS
ncbi:entericidin A/B family lipoprotein [Pectobacterium colocasium]|nr:entericidin A/B family lipoprotein [Pectobacterium sp. PL152]WED70152.1 entericidin A/B family lipoprotein [Pectobacterium colocasium]